MTAREALKRYWQYDDFRPLQGEIVHAVLEGKDTLALMPTGGGKSLCFQVPTMVKEGLCLVITPLIALMKDQVENLYQRGIRAAAIYTGMSLDQQRTALDNCQFGPYHFLYVSPERLDSEAFRQRLSQLPICLIAVDEAHCISQWGYDFRPSYLRIAEVRDWLLEVPVLALTATATPQVADDIQACLHFREKKVLRKSFHRDNLRYVVRTVDNGRTSSREAKAELITRLLGKLHGSGIIYVRNRKHTQEIAELLVAAGVSADYYHAGLSNQERNDKQQAWKTGQTQVMVCTNAFGMGIDKADVRLVIHHDLPDSLEAYYQEAGRAGRDGKPAYAVLLYHPSDKAIVLKRVGNNYPPKDFVAKVYHCTCDFFQIGLGSGLDHTFTLHMDELCRTMRLPLLQTYSAFRLLDQAGYIRFEEEHETAPRVRINVPAHALAEYALSREQAELLDRLMRHYTGIFTDLQYLVDDSQHDLLVSLAQRHILTYIPRTVACTLTMTLERQDDIVLPHRIYEDRQETYTNRLHAMVEYAEQQQTCREQILLRYFGEQDAPACGQCDICRQHTSTAP